jgi:hypothetical protein
MALIKLLVAPIRRVVNFPLFQLTVAIAVIRLYCRFATHIPCEGRHQGCS